MYNMLFGKNPQHKVLLAMLGLKDNEFGRFRDCYYKNGLIVVYTRCGGGNREDYLEMFKDMKKHKMYDSDYDDDYDSTYAYITFRVPEEFVEDIKKIEQEKYTPSDKFKRLIKKMEEDNKKQGDNK